jgi:hypothetical protein
MIHKILHQSTCCLHPLTRSMKQIEIMPEATLCVAGTPKLPESHARLINLKDLLEANDELPLRPGHLVAEVFLERVD